MRLLLQLLIEINLRYLKNTFYKWPVNIEYLNLKTKKDLITIQSQHPMWNRSFNYSSRQIGYYLYMFVNKKASKEFQIISTHIVSS
jgi:hypothetical protein